MLPPTLGVQTSSIVPHWADCWTSPSAGTICIPTSKTRGFIRFPNPSIFDKQENYRYARHGGCNIYACLTNSERLFSKRVGR